VVESGIGCCVIEKVRREVDVPLLADRIDCAVALGRIVSVEEQRVDRLVALEIRDAERLSAADGPAEAAA
jgi:hypothetical protein